MGVVSGWIQSCLFPLPFVPSRRGREKWTFYGAVKIRREENRALSLLFDELSSLDGREIGRVSGLPIFSNPPKRKNKRFNQNGHIQKKGHVSDVVEIIIHIFMD